MGAPTQMEIVEGTVEECPSRLKTLIELLFLVSVVLLFGVFVSAMLMSEGRVKPLPPHHLSTTSETPDTTDEPATVTQSFDPATVTQQPGSTTDQGSIDDESSSFVIPSELLQPVNWNETISIVEQQPFMRELEALNFTKPVRRSAHYRLCGDDIPLLYDVSLSVFIRGREGRTNSEFTGKIRINFKRIGLPSHTVELNAFGMYIVEAHLRNAEGLHLRVKHDRDNRKQALIVTVAEQLQTGQEYGLELSWSDVPTTDNVGLYETWFTYDNGTESVSLTTHGESMHTRKWLPCFDEPRFKAPLKLSIEHPATMKALSNAPIETTKSTKDGRSITVFERSWTLPSYLYAFSVTDYVSQADEIAGLPVAAHIPAPLSSLLPQIMDTIKSTVPSSLKILKATHINKKIDFVFLPDHNSAMENPGHISFGTEFIRRPDTFVHEMMHQYFGNLITLSWWSDVWINEGLTNYYEEFVTHEEGTESSLSSLRSIRYSAMSSDVYSTSLPLHNPVETFLESRLNFRNPYSKGAIITHMLRDFVGKRGFDDEMERMLADRANSTLSLEQFIEYVSSAGGKEKENAASIARDFLTKTGYPLLIVRNVGGVTIIKQVRLRRGFVDERQRDWNTLWTLPIHLVTLDGSYQTTVVMHNNVSDIEVIYPQKLIIAPKRLVYYRVIYDRDTYKAIANCGLSDTDKDYIEFDLVTAAQYGYANAEGTFEVVMRRKSESVIHQAHESLLSIFEMDDSILEEVRKLLEQISGHKLKRRQLDISTHMEHPLMQRRHQREAAEEKNEEEGETEEESEYCAKIGNMQRALTEYNKLLPYGGRSGLSLFCLPPNNTTDEQKYERWITAVFDNHDNTFHEGDRDRIIGGIIMRTPTDFVQNYIAKKLPKENRYFSIALHAAIRHFSIKHTPQIKYIMENYPQAATDNWLDIANIFERYHAAQIESSKIGPEIVQALRRMLAKADGEK